MAGGFFDFMAGGFFDFMAGGFFEQTQFGKNAARKCHLPRQRSVFLLSVSSCMQANCK
jgi:hypothetical protein